LVIGRRELARFMAWRYLFERPSEFGKRGNFH
jgi:hypothetical protein